MRRILKKSFMLFAINGVLISGLTGCASENAESIVSDVTGIVKETGSELLNIKDKSIEETDDGLQEIEDKSIEDTAKELYEKWYPVLIGIVYKENFIFNKDKEISFYIDGEKIERLKQGEQFGYGLILSKGIHTIAIANNILNADLKTFVVGEDVILGKGFANVFIIGTKFKSGSAEITDMIGTNIDTYTNPIKAWNTFIDRAEIIYAADFTPIGNFEAVLERYAELHPEEDEKSSWDDESYKIAANDEGYDSNDDYNENFLIKMDEAEQESEDYIIQDSDKRYLSKEDLENFSKDELRLARNEIYARHGRIFEDEWLKEYFNSKYWYEGTVSGEDFQDDVFNDYENQNLILITEYEKEVGG